MLPLRIIRHDASQGALSDSWLIQLLEKFDALSHFPPLLVKARGLIIKLHVGIENLQKMSKPLSASPGPLPPPPRLQEELTLVFSDFYSVLIEGCLQSFTHISGFSPPWKKQQTAAEKKIKIF